LGGLSLVASNRQSSVRLLPLSPPIEMRDTLAPELRLDNSPNEGVESTAPAALDTRVRRNCSHLRVAILSSFLIEHSLGRTGHSHWSIYI
jgi:hypothetical protein